MKMVKSLFSTETIIDCSGLIIGRDKTAYIPI